MTKIVSPCVDICKFKRQGHCRGCSMTKAQKSLFKLLKNKAQRVNFIEMLQEQQTRMGGYDGWAKAYRRRCHKRGARDLLAKSS